MTASTTGTGTLLPLTPRRAAPDCSGDDPAPVPAFERITTASHELPLSRAGLQAMSTDQLTSMVEAHVALIRVLDAFQVALLDELGSRPPDPSATARRRSPRAPVRPRRPGPGLRPVPPA